MEKPQPVVRDRDGAVTVYDVCPPIGEDGYAPDGCPGPVVKLVGDRIVLDDVIHFEFNSPKIRTRSTGLVRKVAELIARTPHIEEVSIEGHADARGTEEYNLRLSAERAESTREMLVHFGVDGSTLRVIGHGKAHLRVATPLADPRNRRVEFIVTKSADVQGPPVALPSTSPSPRVASGKRGRP